MQPLAESDEQWALLERFELLQYQHKEQFPYGKSRGKDGQCPTSNVSLCTTTSPVNARPTRQTYITLGYRPHTLVHGPLPLNISSYSYTKLQRTSRVTSLHCKTV